MSLLIGPEQYLATQKFPYDVAQSQQAIAASQQELKQAQQMQPYKIQQMQAEAAGTQADTQTKQLDMVMKKSQRVMELAGTAYDEPSFRRALGQAKNEGLDTSQLDGQPYSPQLVQQIHQQAMGTLNSAQLQAKFLYQQANFKKGLLNITGDTDKTQKILDLWGMGQGPYGAIGMAGSTADSPQQQPPQTSQGSPLMPVQQDVLGSPAAAPAGTPSTLPPALMASGVGQMSAPQAAAMPVSTNVQTIKGMGGTVGIKAKQIMDSPNSGVRDIVTAMSLAQKMPEGTTVINGQIVPIAGMLNTQGQIAFTKAQQGGLGEAAAASAKSEQHGQGETLAGMDKENQIDAQKAVSEKVAYQDVMRHLNPETWTSGPIAGIQLSARAALNNISQLLGVNSADAQKMEAGVVDQQTFAKSAIKLLRTATRELSSREAVQGMLIVGKSLPGEGLDAGTIQNIASRAMGLDDYMTAKAAAGEQWKNTHGGSLKGFDGDFRSKVLPDAFVFDYLPPEKQTQLAKDILRQPNGVKQLQQIMQSRNYALQNGMINAGQ